jgi:hypothetical protein
MGRAVSEIPFRCGRRDGDSWAMFVAAIEAPAPANDPSRNRDVDRGAVIFWALVVLIISVAFWIMHDIQSHHLGYAYRSGMSATTSLSAP